MLHYWIGVLLAFVGGSCTRFGYGEPMGAGSRTADAAWERGASTRDLQREGEGLGSAEDGTASDGRDGGHPERAGSRGDGAPARDGAPGDSPAIADGGQTADGRQPDDSRPGADTGSIGPTPRVTKPAIDAASSGPLSVAVDGAGNVYVAAAYMGSAIVGGTTLGGSGIVNTDTYLACFGSNGRLRWVKELGGAGLEKPGGLAADAAGNTYLTGYTTGTDLDLGGGKSFAAGGSQFFLVSYDSAGAWRWERTTGTANSGIGRVVRLGAGGELYFAASCQGSLSVGGASLCNTSQANVLLASFGLDGGHRWSFDYGSKAGLQVPERLAVSGDGLAVCGSFYDRFSLGGSTLSAVGISDVFVAVFNLDGKHRWSRSYGTNLADACSGAGIDAAGKSYFAFSLFAPVPFGSTTVGPEALLAFERSGTERWATTTTYTISDMTVDSAANLAVIGSFRDPLTLGGQVLTSAGGTDVFVADLAGSGGYRWAEAHGGQADESFGRIWMGGTTLFATARVPGKATALGEPADSTLMVLQYPLQ